jgi:hypothetical protein
MYLTNRTMCVGRAIACLLALLVAATSYAGVAYPDPAGGWNYLFDGNAAAAGSGGFTALDGTWSHDDGSDEWDGSSIGTGSPGGISPLMDGTTTYLRIQDTGDPRDYGFADPGSNRKLYLGHDITAEGAAGNVLDAGVTLTFRARVATGDPLDSAHPDGGGGTTAWPAGGDGYVIHDSGKGPVSIKQANGGVVSFALSLDVEDSTSFSGGGLSTNNLNGNAISGDVDWQGNDPGTTNLLPLDPTAWHEFWITIEAGGTGTHVVNVYRDGSLTSDAFEVTAGTGDDFGGISYIAIGSGSTPQQGAYDLDFIGWKAGAVPPVPEPSGLLLIVCAALGLVSAVRRS